MTMAALMNDGTVATDPAMRHTSLMVGRDSDPGPVHALDLAACAIVVIEPRKLIRDCLVTCLTMGRRDYEVLAFPTTVDWLKSRNGAPPQETVIVRYVPGRCRSKAFEQEIDSFSRLDDPVSVVLISDGETSEEIVEAISRGARGYIPTSVSLKVAVEAMSLVRAGGIFVPASSLLSRGGKGSRERTGTGSRFTPRQASVLECLQQGKSNKVIAFELDMKESTVKVHVRHLMRKFGVHNRTEVAVMAMGLADQDWTPQGARP